jgi:hypothetical protein
VKLCVSVVRLHPASLSVLQKEKKPVMDVSIEDVEGYSACLIYGQWGGFACGFDGPVFRIVLGYVGVIFAPYDIEVLVTELHEEAKKNEA